MSEIDLVPFAKNAYYRRISAREVELVFKDIDVTVLILEPDGILISVSNKPKAIFYIEDPQTTEYWTDLSRLRRDFAGADAKHVLRLLLIDVERELRPYKAFNSHERVIDDE